MFYVYILQSEVTNGYYSGFTTQSISDRLVQHNKGDCLYTRKFRPWKIVWYGVFSSQEKAFAFERYIKSGSGHAFSRKRLV